MRPLPPLVRDTSDPDELAFADRIQREDEDREAALWAQQLGSYDGRQFVWAVLQRLPGLDDIGVGEPIDVPRTFRQLGRRSVWLELCVWLDFHPEFREQMRKEAAQRHTKRLKDIEAERGRLGLQRRDEDR